MGRFFSSKKEGSHKDGSHLDNVAYLSNAVERYMDSITQGDYKSELPETDWTPEDESKLCRALLNNFSEHFEIQNFPNQIQLGVPKIAHFLASLTIFKELLPLTSNEDKLIKFNTIGAGSQVRAGMPGPCLIYLQLISNSSQLDNRSKLGIIYSLIVNLEENHIFGALGDNVLSVMIDKYLLEFENLDECTQSNLADTKKRLSKQEKQLNKQDLTLIDQYIMDIWEKLDIEDDYKHICHSAKL